LVIVSACDRPTAVRWPSGPETAASDEAARVGGRELLIVIDGEAVLSEFGLGMEPNDLLDPTHPLIPPADGSTIVATVQRCGCGETGCATLQMGIRRDGDEVVWFDATTRGVPYPVGPFRFAAPRYEEIVRRVHEHRPWESRPACIARLLGYRFESIPDERGLTFDWASEHSEAAVLVSFMHTEPNPEAGQRRGIIPKNESTGWSTYGVEPPEIRTQHLGLFLLAAGSDADSVTDLESRIRTTDPADWSRPPRPPRRHRTIDTTDSD